VLLLEGSEADARSMAQQFPALRLVVYESKGDAPPSPIQVGDTVLVTPGDRAKSIVRIDLRPHGIGRYSAVKLNPDIPDDKDVARIYKRYLIRVTDEDLLAQVPRSPSKPFVGSGTCGSCHGEALRVWKHSGHYRALATLEREGHGRDPDCVPCHVVGLTSEHGFVSRVKTPQLASVGCESCHGPGREHSISPRAFKMATPTEQTCIRCHTSDNSPGFDYKVFWRRIVHK
jgi:hypothetical protein